MNSIISLSLFLSSFFLALTIHEVAHGWIALKLGDPTAKISGRLTLNPLKHIDPLGTIIIPVLLYLFHSPIIFGSAKPVPVNFSRLRNPKRDIVLVGLAGPVANLILAVLIGIIFRLNLVKNSNLFSILQTIGLLNLALAVFNLIPIPPLDGSRVMLGLLPNRLAYRYAQLEPFGMYILIILLVFGLLQLIIWPIFATLALIIGIM
jgi:Zn-dependent protease